MELKRRRREGTRKNEDSTNPLEGERYLCYVCVFNGGVKNFQIKIRLMMSFAFHRLIICFNGLDWKSLLLFFSL